MGHDPSKVLMGSVKTNSREVTRIEGDPRTFKAGLAIRLKSDDTPSLLLADGKWLGVSLGKGLDDTNKSTTVARDGLGVPALIEAGASQAFTITSYANLIATSDDTLKLGATTFTFKASPSTESEVGAVTNNNTTAANLATKINAHSVAGLAFRAVAVNAVVKVTALDPTLAGSAIDAVYTSNGSVGLTIPDSATKFVGGAGVAPAFLVIGSKVYFSNTTGKADASDAGSTISDAIYVSGIKTAMQEDGSLASCAYVDMQGGL